MAKSSPLKKESKTSAKKTAVKTVKVSKKVKTEKKVVSAPVPEPSEEKKEIISKFQVNDSDTGSPEVQVALLSGRIEKLVSHLKLNSTDNHSRRGLLGIVSKRRRLLNYLEKKDEKRYKGIIDKLGLGK
ncbi:30S ribosomal protein S15 [Candidatus Gottesmanbacteria bacterium]|nr:30S ribosomal protein S15 [Candidatus Gottesmanbacteria bacterium]